MARIGLKNFGAQKAKEGSFLRATRRNFAAATQCHSLKPSSHCVEYCVENDVSRETFLSLRHAGFFFSFCRELVFIIWFLLRHLHNRAVFRCLNFVSSLKILSPKQKEISPNQHVSLRTKLCQFCYTHLASHLGVDNFVPSAGFYGFGSYGKITGEWWLEISLSFLFLFDRKNVRRDLAQVDWIPLKCLSLYHRWVISIASQLTSPREIPDAYDFQGNLKCHQSQILFARR